MRIHRGISVTLRMDDILMNGRASQGSGLPVDGNSQRGGLTAVAFISGKKGRVTARKTNEWVSK